MSTDPYGNDTEYEFNGTDDSGQSTFSFAEDRELHYAGCGPHDTFSNKTCSGSGTLMKTISNVLASVGGASGDTNTPAAGQGGAYKPTTVTTTIPVTGGNRITKQMITYVPSYGTCQKYTTFNQVETTPPQAYNITPCYQYPATQSVASYGYGTLAAGSLIHADTTTYAWQSSPTPYQTANMLNIPSKQVRTDSNGTWAAETDYGYDTLGNLTSVSKVTSSGGAGLTTSYTNSAEGLPTLITDPKGLKTSISYQCSNAFPESVVTPYQSTSTTVETTTYGYDCTTGQITSVTDPNGQETSYSYSDPLNRLTEANYPDGGSISLQYADSDSGTPSTVTSTQATGGAEGSIVKESEYDGLGRKLHDILSSDPSGADYVDTSYDLLGRVSTVSNPHLPSSPVSTEDGTTTFTYDALGRKVVETEPDGSTQQWCYGGTSLNGASNCHVNEAGNNDIWVDHADQTGKDWQQTTDGAGRMSEAMEPNTSNVPSLKTDYGYDANDNLIRVTQHGGTSDTARVRVFAYDALSRMTGECNPEALASGSTTCTTSGTWSRTYTYDGDSNVQTRTDRRGIATTYTYDDMNRVTAKNYSDGELNAYFLYDSAGFCPSINQSSYPIGHMTFAWTSPATSNQGIDDPNAVAMDCMAYDSIGRADVFSNFLFENMDSQPTVGGSTSWQFDKAGNTITVESANNYALPEPIHTLNYSYDAAGRVTSIVQAPNDNNDADWKNGNIWKSYEVPATLPTTIFQAVAKNGDPAYHAMGLEHAQIIVNSSSQPMVYLDQAFDKRGRPSSGVYTAGAGAVSGAGAQLYSYSMGYLGNGSVSSAADSVVGTIAATYDNLNRMNGVRYTGGAYGGISGVWAYDNFGNQLSQTLSGSSPTPVPGSTTTQYDAHNHISFTSRDSSALPYDANGNMYYDVQDAYGYDAENRLCVMKSGSTYKLYIYDPLGNRIAKGNITPSGSPNPPTAALCNPINNSFTATSSYAFDLNGNEVENYTGAHDWHNTNVYVGGKVIATYAGNYLSIPMTDWQGTRRAQLENTQANSAMMKFISLPYGDGFTMVNGSSFDTLVQYTQQQYNQENNLYNFKARFLGDWVGRFMSPDSSSEPAAVPYADVSDPQTLNLYGFVHDNPFSFIDDDGHQDDGVQQVCTFALEGSACDVTAKPCKGCTKQVKADPTTVYVNDTFLPVPATNTSVGGSIMNIPTVRASHTVAPPAASPSPASQQCNNGLILKSLAYGAASAFGPNPPGSDPVGDAASASKAAAANPAFRLTVEATASQVGRRLLPAASANKLGVFLGDQAIPFVDAMADLYFGYSFASGFAKYYNGHVSVCPE